MFFKATYVACLLYFFGVHWCLLGQISSAVERGCAAILCYHAMLYVSCHVVYIMSCYAGMHYAWSWQPQCIFLMFAAWFIPSSFVNFRPGQTSFDHSAQEISSWRPSWWIFIPFQFFTFPFRFTSGCTPALPAWKDYKPSCPLCALIWVITINIAVCKKKKRKGCSDPGLPSPTAVELLTIHMIRHNQDC